MIFPALSVFYWLIEFNTEWLYMSWNQWIKTTVIIIIGLVYSQDHIEKEKKMFVLNHIRSVDGESRITSDYLQDIRTQKGKAKHTLIVFIKKEDDTLASLYRKLESLISTKIMKGECDKRPPLGTCSNGMFLSYFKCRVTMDETGINSVLVEFTSFNDRNPECHFSKHGEIYLGIGQNTGVESSQKKTNSFILNHLFGSKLFKGKSCTRK